MRNQHDVDEHTASTLRALCRTARNEINFAARDQGPNGDHAFKALRALDSIEAELSKPSKLEMALAEYETQFQTTPSEERANMAYAYLRCAIEHEIITGSEYAALQSRVHNWGKRR